MIQYRDDAKKRNQHTALRAFEPGVALTARQAMERLGDRSLSATRSACLNLAEKGLLEIVGTEPSKFGPSTLYALPGTVQKRPMGSERPIELPHFVEMYTPPLPRFKVLRTRTHRLAHDEAAV